MDQWPDVAALLKDLRRVMDLPPRAEERLRWLLRKDELIRELEDSMERHPSGRQSTLGISD